MDAATARHRRPRAAPGPPRRNRPLWLAGLLLVTCGAGLLGWFGWQVYVTDWLSQREHRATVQELERAWARPEGGRSGSDTATGSPAVPAGAVGILRIPALGADYAVPLVTGVDDEALASGVGVYDDAEAPGAAGNLTLAGHRVTHGEPFVRMPDLDPGDEVVVETRETTYTYVLDTDPEDLVVDLDTAWVLADRPRPPERDMPGPSAGRRLLTLTTCAELFHTDDRLVAFGHLVDRQPRGA